MPERRGRKHEMLEPPRAIVCFYEGFNKAAGLKIISFSLILMDYMQKRRAEPEIRADESRLSGEWTGRTGCVEFAHHARVCI